MLALERTVLAQLKLTLGILSILLGSIIFLLAFSALHSDYFYGCFLGHFCPLVGMIQLPNRIELLTSTLPWLRSTD